MFSGYGHRAAVFIIGKHRSRLHGPDRRSVFARRLSGPWSFAYPANDRSERVAVRSISINKWKKSMLLTDIDGKKSKVNKDKRCKKK